MQKLSEFRNPDNKFRFDFRKSNHLQKTGEGLMANFVSVRNWRFSGQAFEDSIKR